MKRRKGIIIIVFLGYAFISLLCINNLFAEPQAKEDSAKAAADIRPQNKPILGIVPREAEDYKGDGLRDPFRDYFDTIPPPPVVVDENAGTEAQQQAMPVLEIQGIILGGRFNQAIINNKIVKVGDNIEGVRVTTIEKDGVTVFFGNKSYNISSPAAGILQDAKKKPEGGGDEKKL